MVFVNVAMVFIFSREIYGTEEVEGLVDLADRNDEERPLIQKRRKRQEILVPECIFNSYPVGVAYLNIELMRPE